MRLSSITLAIVCSKRQYNTTLLYRNDNLTSKSLKKVNFCYRREVWGGLRPPPSYSKN